MHDPSQAEAETPDTRRASLTEAYTHTAYRVPELSLDIRIGHLCPDLDLHLARHGMQDWAFIIAENPGSKLLSGTENRARTEALRRQLSGKTFFDGQGASLCGNWPPEAGFLIQGISLPEALALGRRFGQLAIVAGNSGCPAGLHWCGGEPDQRSATRSTK